MGFEKILPSFRDGPKDQTRNLEIPGSLSRPGMMVWTAPDGISVPDW
jgi:hypothetical protein